MTRKPNKSLSPEIVRIIRGVEMQLSQSNRAGIDMSRNLLVVVGKNLKPKDVELLHQRFIGRVNLAVELHGDGEAPDFYTGLILDAANSPPN